MEECKKNNMRTTRSSVESCALIFAFINIILAAMSIIVTSHAVYSEMAYISHYFGRQERTENMDITLSVLMSTFIVAMTLSLIGFAFSIILVMGVLQRKAGYVKAYFVFGIIATVITFMCTVALILLVQDVDIYTIYFFQGGCMVYLAILAMIWITHQRIEKIEKDNQVWRMIGSYMIMTTARVVIGLLQGSQSKKQFLNVLFYSEAPVYY